MCLLLQVEKCLRATALTPTRFGRDAIGDPRLVFDLRRGREPRQRTADRIRAYISAVSEGMAR